MEEGSSVINPKLVKSKSSSTSLKIKLKLHGHEHGFLLKSSSSASKNQKEEVDFDVDDELEEGEIRADDEDLEDDVEVEDDEDSSPPRTPSPPPPPPPAADADVDMEEVEEEEKEEGGDDGDEKEEEEEEEEAVVDIGSRICVHCDKVFKNGKALGGHMRVHKPPPTKKTTETAAVDGCSPPSSAKNKEVVVVVEGEDNKEEGDVLYKCKLCPKEFPSEKSLYGHMRSHPERGYRGMDPPNMAEAAEARLRRLGTWNVTGKRGRQADSTSPVGSSSSASSFLNTAPLLSEEAAAAAILLSLKAAGAGEEDEEKERANKKGKSVIRAHDDDEIYYLKNLGLLPDYYTLPPSPSSSPNNPEIKENPNPNPNPNHDYYNYINNLDGGIKVYESKKMVKFVENYDKVGPTSSKIKGIKKVVSGKINQKMIKENFDEININFEENNNNNNNNNNNIKVWTCYTCGKCFPTHQALGGHRSSHNKDKYNHGAVQTRMVNGSGLADTVPNTENGGVGGGVSIGEEVEVVANEDDDVAAAVQQGVHKCKICKKIFPSGQALGGHQRCHYVVPSSGGEVSTSPGQINCQTGCRRGDVDLIDLNVVPTLMDEDDNGDVTVDSASNKYCS